MSFFLSGHTSMARHIKSAACLAIGLLAQAASAAGLLTPANSNLPTLEIRKHLVEVSIQDGYAITEIEQTFHNPHAQDLDAMYAFPIPEKAAVSEFTVWIDGLPVSGEVLEKNTARQIHEEEKAAGRETGLAEQNGYRRFEVSVSPVRAGQDTRIRLQYMQPTDIKTGIGRYLYPLEEGGTDDKQMAFWSGNEVVTEQFRFRLNLRSSVPIDAVRAPNMSDASISQTATGEWQLEVNRIGNPAAQQRLSTQSNIQNDDGIATELQTSYRESQAPSHLHASTLDQDLIIYWRLADNIPGSVDLIAHKTPNVSEDGNTNKADQGTFMLAVTPGDDLARINEGRDWVFVLDISGSMNDKYATLTAGVQRAFEKMSSNDRFRIVLFNNQARELTAGWQSIGPDTIAFYSDKMNAVSPGNGTDLYAGLSQGLRSVKQDRTTGLILVTDGVANVGETQKRKFIELLKNYDVRIFTFIMGNEANRPLLESISKASNGFALNVSNSDDIVGKLMEATQRINHQAMHGVELTFSGVKTSDVTPQHIGSIYRGEQIVVFGHYWGSGELKISLKGKVSGQSKHYETSFQMPALAQNNPEIERLWAFASIQALQAQSDLYGEDADRQQAMIELATEYSLVTEHTSMVVMRDAQFAARGISRKNQQRLQIEAAAQIQRNSQPAAQHRVDTNTPMFTQNRASHSGSGALDIWWLLIITPLLLVTFSRKTATSTTV